MARVTDLLFALKADEFEGKGISVNNLFSALNPEYVPGLFSFSVVIALLDLDKCGTHFLSVKFLDPNQEETIKIDKIQLPVDIKQDGNLPNEHCGLHICMEWNNVNFKMSGIYTAVVSYDDEEIYKKEIYVKGKNQP